VVCWKRSFAATIGRGEGRDKISAGRIMLRRVTLKGFKSIKEMDLELRAMNILIGANGWLNLSVWM
jgi:hypothetical protein